MKILRHGQVTSTNDIALELAANGAESWTVVTADEQTIGRGRRNAKWVSPPGANLYLSVILRPDPPLKPAQIPEIAFITSLATAKAIREYGIDARIKWPNDILINGKKLAGILIEAVPSQGAVVIGIGLNVNWSDFPTELVEIATSVEIELGQRVDVEHCLQIILTQLKNAWNLYERGFAFVMQEWKSLECTTGRKVKVELDGEVISGLAIGVDGYGGLIVKLASGEAITVTAAKALIEG